LTQLARSSTVALVLLLLNFVFSPLRQALYRF
jgi:hypothetical protein